MKTAAQEISDTPHFRSAKLKPTHAILERGAGGWVVVKTAATLKALKGFQDYRKELLGLQKTRSLKKLGKKWAIIIEREIIDTLTA